MYIYGFIQFIVRIVLVFVSTSSTSSSGTSQIVLEQEQGICTVTQLWWWSVWEGGTLSWWDLQGCLSLAEVPGCFVCIKHNAHYTERSPPLLKPQRNFSLKISNFWELKLRLQGFLGGKGSHILSGWRVPIVHLWGTASVLSDFITFYCWVPGLAASPGYNIC